MNKQFFLSRVVASTTYHIQQLKKRLFLKFILLLFVFVSASTIEANPLVYTPLLLIDCKKSERVYQKSCFRHIAYLARAIDYSGLFEDVQSPAHIYFMTNLGKGYVSFEKKRPYRSRKWRDLILQRYQDIFSLSVDKTQRYVLFSVAQSQLLVDEPEYPKQLEQLKKTLEAYLLGKPVRYFFANSPSFAALHKANFLEIAMHVELFFDDNKSFFQNQEKIKNMEAQIKSIKGVKTTFSGTSVFRELSVLFKNSSWQQLAHFYEFADGARSSYWQPAKKNSSKQGKYFIALFQKANEKIDAKEVLQLLKNSKKNPFETKLKIYSIQPLPFPQMDLEAFSSNYISIFEYLNKKRF